MRLIQTFKSKQGTIELFFLEYEKAFLAKPSGFISSRLLRQYLKALKKLDQEHKTRVHHIVDTSDVTFASPLNPFYLRTINKLEHVDLYIVIVPIPFLRYLVKLTKWINNPDFIFKSMSACNAFLNNQHKSI